jgi:hypothetical protein
MKISKQIVSLSVLMFALFSCTFAPEKPADRKEADAPEKLASVAPGKADVEENKQSDAPEKDAGKSNHEEADKLIQQAGQLGLKAESDNDVKMGKQAMALFRQATDVAPDYPKAWKSYAESLTKLKDRFGHSVVMSNREIRRELKRCKEALAGLS